MLGVDTIHMIGKQSSFFVPTIFSIYFCWLKSISKALFRVPSPHSVMCLMGRPKLLNWSTVFISENLDITWLFDILISFSDTNTAKADTKHVYPHPILCITISPNCLKVSSSYLSAKCYSNGRHIWFASFLTLKFLGGSAVGSTAIFLPIYACTLEFFATLVEWQIEVFWNIFWTK